MSILNESGDILVGHAGKISIIKSEDFMSKEIYQQYIIDSEELDLFYKLKSKLADSDLYFSLKQKDDLLLSK